VILGDDAASLGGYNSFAASNSISVYNALASTLMAENNWWGDEDGPAPGDTVGPVDCDPFLRGQGQFGPRTPEFTRGAVVLRYRNPFPYNHRNFLFLT
jgi:hypothetical protein